MHELHKDFGYWWGRRTSLVIAALRVAVSLSSANFYWSKQVQKAVNTSEFHYSYFHNDKHFEAFIQAFTPTPS